MSQQAGLELTHRPFCDSEARAPLDRRDGVGDLSLGRVLDSLKRIMEAKDPGLKSHCDNVGSYALAVAQILGLDKVRAEQIGVGALLHDIGKIRISDAVLHKPGRLSPKEFGQIKSHPGVGAEILRPLNLSKITRDAVLFHHERADGRGYPYGLVGEQIPVAARIVSVVDAFDAMTTKRSYRRCIRPYQAVEELQCCAGSQFDPQIVEALRLCWRSGKLEAGQHKVPCLDVQVGSRASRCVL